MITTCGSLLFVPVQSPRICETRHLISATGHHRYSDALLTVTLLLSYFMRMQPRMLLRLGISCDSASKLVFSKCKSRLSIRDSLNSRRGCSLCSISNNIFCSLVDTELRLRIVSCNNAVSSFRTQILRAKHFKLNSLIMNSIFV